MGFLGYKAKSFLGFEGSRSETQGCYYCIDREYRYVTKDRVFNQKESVHRPSCVNTKEENGR